LILSAVSPASADRQVSRVAPDRQATAFLVLIRVMGTFCGPRQESRGKILHFREVSSL
jgi:hypothetical protein